MSVRLKTVLHPRYANVKQYDMPPLKASDFIAVPAIKTYGTWSVLDLISMDDKAKMFGLVKFLEKQARTR